MEHKTFILGLNDKIRFSRPGEKEKVWVIKSFVALFVKDEERQGTDQRDINLAIRRCYEAGGTIKFEGVK